ncbi:MAG: GGDEF domain-containing protein [Humidesulfovibrio sp.]|uniref:GGDEF domain-containing protein n=1 Tax=Humidesulfovibrio sp. TaxID=2910988 RepID=UPI0027F0C1D9|nr:GGDEF domain-containing protein [Humidesulfovibrio sp.]MDQ7835269.1 GGDEF domain-containing protein [Humidesulfovibrio sp.]
MAENLLLNSPHLLQKISLSPVMLRLMQEAVKPEPDFAVMADTIRLDPALATTVLNLVNSAFYGLPQKVTDLHRAVSVLGSRELLKVAVAMSLQKDLEHGFPDCEYDFFPDWRLIVWSAIAAELLAARLCPRQADQAYLCALLKDVSLLFLRCAAKELLADPDRRDRITVLEKGQLAFEEERWGMHHGALSQMLLTRWGIPAEMCESIRAHHAMETLSEQSPLTQAVILATQWSEMELGHASGPFSVVQFEVLLRGVLGMSEREVDSLRSECLEKFRSMLESLGIGEGDQNRAYYRHSVKVMQGYCFLSMDLLTAEGGLMSVARTMGKHIKLNWDVKSWDLALRTPHGNSYSLFHLTQEGILEQAQSRVSEGRLPWRIKRPGVELTSSGKRLGELRLGETSLPQDEMDNLGLYLRFFSQGYEYYCARQAVLEEKALAFDKIPIGVARVDGAGIVVEANKRIGEYLGLDTAPRGQALAEMLSMRLSRETVAEVSAFLADTSRASFGKIVYFVEQKRGGRSDGCLYLSAHRSQDSKGHGVLLLLEDLRELSEVEVQTLRRKNFLERLVGSMQELVLTVSAKGVVDFCSHQELGLTGREFFKVFTPQQPFDGVWGPELFAVDQPSPVEALLTTQGGSQLPYELSLAPLTGKPGTAREYLVVGRDLTQIRRLEAKLKVRALFDGLTGLFNHYQFHTTLEREVVRCRRTGRSMGMVFFDLDKFKAVNDTQGHLAGDALLKGVGAMLLRQVRQGMDYPCRYGGDEFVIILTEVDEEGLHAIGQRILVDVRELFKGLVTVSVGASMLREDDTPETLLKRADNLAYASKTAGGDTLTEG